MNDHQSLIADSQSQRALWPLRLVLVALALVLWFWTQSLIGKRAFPGEGIGDGLHTLTAPLHHYLLDHPAAANGLLIVSSAFIDAFALFILGSGVFGPTLRPFVGLLMLFALRQACQALCALPPPPGMIWRDPGFPSLLVTYGVANDLFFSGHTALAVYGAIELARLNRRWLTFAAASIALFEAATVIVLRAHYTMDVFTGAITAFLVAVVAARFAPACDRAVDRLRTKVQR